MRHVAAVTSGRFIFLTDDSGIGDSHEEPKIPCYYVTTLADAMRRAITMEITGRHILPAEADVIRRVGSRQGLQYCSTRAGDTVVVY